MGRSRSARRGVGWDAVVAAGAASHIAFLVVALCGVMWSPATFSGITAVPLDRMVDCEGLVSFRTGVPKEQEVAEQGALLQIASVLIVLSMAAMATSTATLPGALRAACSSSKTEAPWVASLRWAIAMPSVCIVVCLFTLIMRIDSTYGDYDSLDPSLPLPVCRTTNGFPVLVVNLGSFSQVCSLMMLVPRRLVGERNEIAPWAIAAVATNITGMASVALMIPFFTQFIFDMRQATYALMLGSMAGAGIYLFITTAWIETKVSIPLACVSCATCVGRAGVASVHACCPCCACCKVCKITENPGGTRVARHRLSYASSASWFGRKRSARVTTAAAALDRTISREASMRKPSAVNARSFVEVLPPPLAADETAAGARESSTYDRTETIVGDGAGRPFSPAQWRMLSLVRPDTLGALPHRKHPETAAEEDRKRSAQVGDDVISMCGINWSRVSVRTPPSNVAVLVFMMLIDSGYLLSVSLLTTGFGQHAFNLACIVTFVSVPLSLAVVSGAHRRAVIAASETSLREQARSLHRMIAFVSNEARNPVSAAMLGADMAKADIDQLLLRVRHRADTLEAIASEEADAESKAGAALESVRGDGSVRSGTDLSGAGAASSRYQDSMESSRQASGELLTGLHRALDSLTTVTTGLSTARAVLSDSLGLQHALEAQSDSLKPSWMTLSELVDPLRIMYSGVRPKPEAPSKPGIPDKVLVSFIVDGGLVLDDGMDGRTAPQLYCDSSAVSQVITNFVSNALKHAHSRVSVRVVLALPAELDGSHQQWPASSLLSGRETPQDILLSGSSATGGTSKIAADDRHGVVRLAAPARGKRYSTANALIVAMVCDNGPAIEARQARQLFRGFEYHDALSHSVGDSNVSLAVSLELAVLLGGGVSHRQPQHDNLPLGQGSEFVLAVPVKIRTPFSSESAAGEAIPQAASSDARAVGGILRADSGPRRNTQQDCIQPVVVRSGSKRALTSNHTRSGHPAASGTFQATGAFGDHDTTDFGGEDSSWGASMTPDHRHVSDASGSGPPVGTRSQQHHRTVILPVTGEASAGIASAGVGNTDDGAIRAGGHSPIPTLVATTITAVSVPAPARRRVGDASQLARVSSRRGLTSTSGQDTRASATFDASIFGAAQPRGLFERSNSAAVGAVRSSWAAAPLSSLYASASVNKPTLCVVVDHSDLNRRALTMVLRRAGCEVSEAADGATGLAMLRRALERRQATSAQARSPPDTQQGRVETAGSSVGDMLVVAGGSQGSQGRSSVVEAMASPSPLRQMRPLASLPETKPVGTESMAESDGHSSSDYLPTDGSASVSPAIPPLLAGVHRGNHHATTVSAGASHVAGPTAVSAGAGRPAGVAPHAESHGSLGAHSVPSSPNAAVVVLFVERMLPGLDGVSMLQAAMQDPALMLLGASDPHTLQVVGMTNSPDLASSLSAAGAHQVLIKPFERSQALNALAKCLRPGSAD